MTESAQPSPELRLRRLVCDGDFQAFEEAIDGDPSLLFSTTVFGNLLHVAAKQGRLDFVERLLDCGLPIDAIGGVPECAAIAHAASRGHLDVVRFLLERGAKFDVSASIRNPLFAAICGRHSETAKFLIDQGIDTQVAYTSETMQNMDALAFAREQGCLEVIPILERLKRDAQT